MASTEQTSLERFVRTRGKQLLGHNQYGATSKTQIIFGKALVVAGLLLVSIGSSKELFYVAVGPLIAGFTNLAVGITSYRRSRQPEMAEVQLTSEAKQLLKKLDRKYTGLNYFVNHPATATQTNLFQETLAHQTNNPIPQVLDILEEATYQYNRIAGTLKTASSQLNNMTSKILAAADQTILDIFHQAALYDQFPEGSQAAATRIRTQIQNLQELADRIEQMTTQEPSLTEKLGYRNSMDEVLDELRMDQLARTELRTTTRQDQDTTA